MVFVDVVNDFVVYVVVSFVSVTTIGFCWVMCGSDDDDVCDDCSNKISLYYCLVKRTYCISLL